MSPGATFERVYLGLKERLRQGSFSPGDHIDPTMLGEELASSVTPVRDALHRLVAERLVEAPRGDGFRAPLLTEMSVRNLYGWNADLLILALRSSRAAAPLVAGDEILLSPTAGAEEFAVATEALFLRIARCSANPEHGLALGNNGDRLHPLRLVEGEVLGDLRQELAKLSDTGRRGDPAPVRKLIALYHRRRQRAASSLLEAIYSKASGAAA